MIRVILFQTLGLLAVNFTAMPYYAHPKIQLTIWVGGAVFLFVAATQMLREHLLTERIAMLDRSIAERVALIERLEDYRGSER